MIMKAMTSVNTLFIFVIAYYINYNRNYSFYKKEKSYKCFENKFIAVFLPDKVLFSEGIPGEGVESVSNIVVRDVLKGVIDKEDKKNLIAIFSW